MEPNSKLTIKITKKENHQCENFKEFQRNWKSVAFPVPELVPEKIWQSLDTPMLPFLKNF